MEEIFIVSRQQLNQYMQRLVEEADVWGLLEEERGVSLTKLDRDRVADMVVAGIRSCQPLKSMFYPVREELRNPDAPVRTRIVIGVKNCDLLSLPCVDRIFLEDDCVDPYYQAKRDATLLIACDCSNPGDSCFCTRWGNTPYPGDGADVVLSDLGDGNLLLSAATKKGDAFLADGGLDRSQAGDEYIKRRDEQRAATERQVTEGNSDYSFPENAATKLPAQFSGKAWQSAAETCVACGACTHICPTCHCFFIRDRSLQDTFDRDKWWDSCQYPGYGKVAGGGDPRSRVFERLRNRYYCKLVNRPQKVGTLCCTGCGRCIDACQGRIDMREVLSDVIAATGKKQ